jgi:NADH:ubiquinone oxidoreductase subunit E
MFQIAVCTQDQHKCTLSDAILARFQRLIEEHDLTGVVEACATGCLGVCNKDGVTVQIGSTLLIGVVPDNVDYVFEEYVLDIFFPRAPLAG